jgi:hypothetical protein
MKEGKECIREGEGGIVMIFYIHIGIHQKGEGS